MRLSEISQPEITSTRISQAQREKALAERAGASLKTRSGNKQPDAIDRREIAWKKRAACVGHDPKMWYGPLDGVASYSPEARAICAACLVRQDCLDYAIEGKEYAGLWGGMTRRERQTETKRRKSLLPATPRRRRRQVP